MKRYKVIHRIKIQENTAVTIEGMVDNVQHGQSILDAEGESHILLSVGITKYKNPQDLTKYSDLLISGDVNSEYIVI